VSDPAPPGLQAERTALAWQRTGISAAALAGSVTVAAAHFAATWVLVGVTVLAVLCGAAIALGVRFTHRSSAWPRVMAAAALPTLLALAGVLLSLAPDPP
jgi:uncharacterized membrane protein YidH (DUF202 family)